MRAPGRTERSGVGRQSSAKARDRFGRVDILVNNAGVGQATP